MYTLLNNNGPQVLTTLAEGHNFIEIDVFILSLNYLILNDFENVTLD